MEPTEETLHAHPVQLSLQEQALAAGMLFAQTDATIKYRLASDGTRIHDRSNAIGRNEFQALADEFRYDPARPLAYARENIRAIMRDPNLLPAQKTDRSKRYVDAYLALTTKLDHAAFPAAPGMVRQGIPEYVPDGLVDMGSQPDPDPRHRSREKIKVVKPEIFKIAQPLLYDIFTTDTAGIGREAWKRWVTQKVTRFVYENMPYNNDFSPHPDEHKRSVGLHEYYKHNLAVCRHHALMMQVLLQELGVTSRLMKSQVDFGNGISGDHANNLVRIEGNWYLVDSTNPESVGSGRNKMYIKPVPERNIDINMYKYQWQFPEHEGMRTYRSRANMYWYIQDTNN